MQKGKNKFLSIAEWIGKLTVCVIMGTGLMLFAYSLPVKQMKENVARSSEIFNYEGNYPQLVNGYKYMQLDNYTDSIMLGAAIYDGEESLIEKAVNNYHVDCAEDEGLPAVLVVTNYANDVKYDYFKVSYSRYWHGYLFFLKILLLFFDYGDIRIINFMIQTLLLLRITCLFFECNIKKYFFAFATAIFVINPITAALSLQYSSVYLIILFAGVFLLEIFHRDMVTELKVKNLFFIVGVLTSFLDFLTYPLATFGILMILYLNLNAEKRNKKYIKSVGSYFVLWIVGYAGMWMGKWMVGSILLRKNIFADAINQAMLRISSESIGMEHYTRFETLIVNAGVLLKWPFIILGLFAAIVFLSCLKGKQLDIGKNIEIVFIYLLITFMPVVWLLVFSNHSREHYWFTYKEMSISCFALLSLGIRLIKTDVNKNELR